MSKKFTQNLFFILFLNLLIKPFWIFGVDRTIQNTVGSEEYGIYFVLLNFSLLFNIVSDLGLTNYNNRNIAQNQHLLSNQIGSLVPVKLFLGFAYAIITLIFAITIDYSERQLNLLIILIINQFLISLTLYLRSNISGMQLFKIDGIISVTDKLLLIILCGILLWGNISKQTFKIEWLIYSQTASYSTTAIFALAVVLWQSSKIKLKFSWNSSIRTLRKSLPFAILILLMTFYTRIDSVMLERMLPDGKSQAGIYAQSYRIIDALSMFAFLFASILLPLFAKMIKQNESIKEILSHSFNLLIIPVLALVISIVFYAKNIMDILYKYHVNESTSVLNILIFGFIGISISYIFGTLLTAAGKLKFLNRIALSGVFLNITLNFFLIPQYGVKGAAFSSMLTQLIMGSMQALLSFKLYKIKIKIQSLSRYLLVGFIGLATGFLINYFLKIWYLGFFLIIIFSLVIAFALKLIKIEHFNNMFSNKFSAIEGTDNK